jgi:hypothetical protein
MHRAFFLALICAIVAGGSVSAYAGFTTINPPFYDNEATPLQLMQSLYAPSGPTFTKVGENYTNGTITATRLQDFADIILISDNPAANAIATTGGNLNGVDQLWQANFSAATAKAVFGTFGQEFGYFDGSSGGTYHSLFTSSGWGFGITGGATITDNSLTNQIIRWARGGDNGIFTSMQTDNPDGRDHMVTFRIDGLNNGVSTFLLMFEDKLPGQPVDDFDYNDLVVQIIASPVSVPEPGTASLLVFGTLGALAARRRRA